MLAFSNQAAMRGLFYGPTMPEITELKIAVNTAEVKAGTQAVSDLAAANLSLEERTRSVNSEISLGTVALRAQLAMTREQALAAKALGTWYENQRDAAIAAQKRLDSMGSGYLPAAATATGAKKTGAAQQAVSYQTYIDDVARPLRLQSDAAPDVKKDAPKAKADPARRFSDAEWKEAAATATLFGSKLEKAFGNVGKAIGGMTSALVTYRKAQDEIQFELATSVKTANASTGTDSEKAAKIATATEKAETAQARAKVTGLKEMSSAAKGYFKENSTGYKVMEMAEKTFRAVELAMAVEAMAKKIFFKEGEVAANLSLNTAKAAGEAGASTLSVGLAAEEASAWGVTAVVKAIASLPFPLNIAAGAATLAAVLAIGAKVIGGIGGGGGVDTTAKDRQAAAGTGTVLGDSSAKSDSIAKSIELANQNSAIELSHTAGMLRALLSIRDNIGGMADMVARTSGLRATAIDEKAYSVGSSSGVLGIGAKSTTIKDSGINVIAGQTVGSASDGQFQAKGYADVEKKSSGFFGIGSSSRTKRNDVVLDGTLLKQFSLTIGSLRAGAMEAIDLLGLSGSGAVAKLNAMALDIGLISFKGLSSSEIKDELEAVFSKLGDQMATVVAPEISSFQKAGEGYLQTLTRIATNYANLDSILASIGATFGATGMSSIKARERLLELTGGIDGLADKTNAFAENYLTEAERLAPVQKHVTEQMAALGYASVTTRAQFKDTVLQLANSGALATKTGAEQYAGLMALADAFAKTHAATEDLSKSEQGIADERKGIQDKLDQMTMTSAQLRARERASVDASNLALYDQLQARQDIASAYETESAALKSTIDRLKTFGDGIRTFKDSLLLGSLSTLTPMQKMAEAQRQYEETLAKAKTGDAAAQSGLTAAAAAYLTANQVVKSSSDAYAADAARVQADLAALAAIAGTQLSDAQKQLTALDTQVGQLINLNKTAVGIQEAVDALGAALRAGGKTDITDGMLFGSSFGMPVAAAAAADDMLVDVPAAQAMQRYFSASDGANEALVAEIKGLREEVRQLRADQDQQTGAIISSNYDANERAADKVSAGASEAARASVWASQSKASIV